jgi:regulator of nucleoside diphosphate kinase
MASLILTRADAANLSMLGSPKLLELIRRASLVSTDEVPANVVTMNSRVLYSDATTGKHRRISVVYPAEADSRAGRISVLAPVGMALLGLRTGDCTECVFHDGSRHRLRLEAVLHQPEYHLNAHMTTREV